MSDTIWISGVGMLSAIGQDVPEALKSLEQGRSGVAAMRYLPSVHRDELPVAEVKFSDAELAERAGLPAGLPRTALLSLIAAREALADSGFQPGSGLRTGFLSASTVGGMDRTTEFYRAFMTDKSTGRLRDIVHHECGSQTDLVAEKLGITHFVSTVSTACSSSANSILLAARMIRQGLLDVAIAGGVDCLTTFTLNGFNTLMILDRAPCRPFDQHRAGLNLGEGAGYVVLMSDKALAETGATARCRLSGWGNATDAYHQTASSPEGIGSGMAMHKALEKAGLRPTDIDYINVHGTGTPNNDQSEGTALQRVFGEQCPPFSSTKAFTGHTLGASGGIEAVLSVLAVQHGLIYPNLHFSTPIEGLGLVPETRFQSGRAVRHVLSNSFGFGGNCTSLVFSTPSPPPDGEGMGPVPSPRWVGFIYIDSAAAVSAQNTLSGVLPDLNALPEGNRLRCIEPDYKELIDPKLIRRMSRVVKIGTAAAMACLRDAGADMPGAILTGTAYGCTEDTEVFLQKLIAQHEDMLTPTAFIQSTHNTIGAQIALLLQCHAYNNTFVHRAVSFEHALLDAMLLLQETDARSALVGGVDEMPDTIFQILQRFDLFKNEDAAGGGWFDSSGTVAGEGAGFVYLNREKTARSICRLQACATFFKPADMVTETAAFLAQQGLSASDISLLLSGKNGDRRFDGPYDQVRDALFPQTPTALFKPAFGEFPVATAPAVWLATRLFQEKTIPGKPGEAPQHILIYNHFYNIHHSLILLSAC